ncbi:Cytochrome P450 [Alternaria alternata]|nr:Cytochrome P450 [Alternaria alternata]
MSMFSHQPRAIAKRLYTSLSFIWRLICSHGCLVHPCWRHIIAFSLVVVSLACYKLWKRQDRLKVRASNRIRRHLTNVRQDKNHYAAQMGCKAPRRWAAKWPEGLDLLLRVGQHARAQTILQFFLDVVESSGPTHEQQLRRCLGEGWSLWN